MSKKSFSQPLWFRLLNSAWKNTYPVGTKIRLKKDDLISSAKKKSGLSNPGSDFNDEPLERLIRSAEDEANLHPIGRFITRERLINLLTIRLRAEYFFSKFPEILEQPLYPVWIIIGLQRTGTTKLHRLLSVDPDHRVIPAWEVINPIPSSQFAVPSSHYPHTNPTHRVSSIEHRASIFSVQHHGTTSPVADDRIKIARRTVLALKLLSPGFFAIHPIDINEPEEDILLLDVSFMSTTPEAMMHVPSYAQWLEKTDQSEAYAYAVKLLKFLQWVKPAKRWVLKSPHHLEFPDLVQKHFGEVQFIWPHRNIYESVPSFFSMVTYNRMMFSNDTDPQQIAQHWLRKTGYMLEKALTFRNDHNYLNYSNNLNYTNNFTDINYHDLIDNSIHELEKIYSQSGGISEELKSRFLEHERTHPYQKHGVHQYNLEDFGMTEKDIDQHTSRYQEFTGKLYGRK